MEEDPHESFSDPEPRSPWDDLAYLQTRHIDGDSEIKRRNYGDGVIGIRRQDKTAITLFPDATLQAHFDYPWPKIDKESA
jgi:hypothetical protein